MPAQTTSDVSQYVRQTQMEAKHDMTGLLSQVPSNQAYLQLPHDWLCVY